MAARETADHTVQLSERSQQFEGKLDDQPGIIFPRVDRVKLTRIDHDNVIDPQIMSVEIDRSFVHVRETQQDFHIRMPVDLIIDPGIHRT